MSGTRDLGRPEMGTRRAVRVFVCHAPADRSLWAELEGHLRGLEHSRAITTWCEDRILPGEKRSDVIEQELRRADIVLVLLSASFLQCDYFLDDVLAGPLERCVRGGEKVVIPVLLRPVDWKDTPFGELSCLPSNTLPITSWKDRDEALLDVVRGIRQVLENRANSSRVSLGWNVPVAAQPALAEAREDDQLRAGDTLSNGRYLLLDCIGHGRTATVWRTEDRRARRLVAVKVLRCELAVNAVRRERFFRGAQIMAELEHCAVVPVLSPRCEDRGCHYFVMELITGGDLRRAILEGRLSPHTVIQYVLFVGDALAKVHWMGYVHGNLSSRSILLSRSRAPLLMDFDPTGGADEAGSKGYGAVGESPFSPTELLGRPGGSDPRVDVRGLGEIAMFGILGEETSAGAIRDLEARIPPRLTDNAKAVAETLLRAVESGAERFADAASFCLALATAWTPPREQPTALRSLAWKSVLRGATPELWEAYWRVHCFGEPGTSPSAAPVAALAHLENLSEDTDPVENDTPSKTDHTESRPSGGVRVVPRPQPPPLETESMASDGGTTLREAPSTSGSVEVAMEVRPSPVGMAPSLWNANLPPQPVQDRKLWSPNFPLQRAQDRAPTKDEDERAAGIVIAQRYRVTRKVGEGSQGVIWAAENVRTGRSVALKFLRVGAQNRATAEARFVREGRAVGAIKSDHVLQVLDVEEDPEHGIFLVFELLDGETLISRLRRSGPLPFEVLHPIGEQIWMGLRDAHRAGIVHRDMKPSNVFLDRGSDGVTRVKVLDFGVSKVPRTMGGETLTEMGQSLGTFTFMPPEQIGRSKVVDQRADVYATATVLFQALTGQLPYLARNILIMVEAKGKRDPRTLSEAMGFPVDPALQRFVAKGLERDVTKRFQTAAEALEEWRWLCVL